MAAPLRPGKAPGGFTLVEVLVAATFFLVALTGIVSGLNIAIKQYEHQRHTTAAMALSETVLGELQLLSNSDSQLSAGAHTRYYTEKGSITTSTDPEMKFTALWLVTAGVPVEGLREVRLTLTWNESTGTKSLQMRTVRP